MTTLLLVADDLTGAADACAKFVAHGFSGAVVLARDDDDGGESGGSSRSTAPSTGMIAAIEAVEAVGPVDVLALNTDTRRVNEAEARRRVRAASRVAHYRPAAAIFKKIDSTLRGHVGAELEAAMETFGCSHAIVAPAFPSMGRTVRNGALIVEGPGARPPRDVLALLTAQGVRGCAMIGAAAADGGAGGDSANDVRRTDTDGAAAVAALRASIERALAQGARVLVCDAVSHADLDAIVSAVSALAASAPLEPVLQAAGLPASAPPTSALPTSALPAAPASEALDAARPKGRPLWVGSAGLAEALGASLAAGHDRMMTPPLRISSRGDRVVLFIGSTHALTRAQQAHLLGARDVATIVGGHAHGAAAAAGVHLALNRRRHVLITMDWSRIEPAALRHLIDATGHDAVAGFVMSGGDTAADVCAAMGARGVRVGGEVANGVPWGVLTGGLADGLPLVFKSGGFGTREALLTAVDFLSRLGGDRHVHT